MKKINQTKNADKKTYIFGQLCVFRCDKWKKSGKKFEIVYVPLDKDIQEFKKSCQYMGNWLSVDFNDKTARQILVFVCHLIQSRSTVTICDF